MKEYVAPEVIISILEVEDITNDGYVVKPGEDNDIEWVPGWLSKIQGNV